MAQHGLAPDDVAAWQAMETLHATDRVHLLGISNVQLDQLELLVSIARVPPAIVQNRCYARRGWDRAIRAFCQHHGIVYQGFSLLTANRAELQRPLIDQIMARTGKTREQVAFRFAIQAGMLPLTGTSSEQHMRDDLAVTEFSLDDREVQAIETIAG
jgi:diketogulonate reductase-like aldo/keto reductase